MTDRLLRVARTRRRLAVVLARPLRWRLQGANDTVARRADRYRWNEMQRSERHVGSAKHAEK
jgi:hypothetical protein